MNRILQTLALLITLVAPTHAQVRIDEDVNAQLAAQRIQVAVVGSDAALVNTVSQALGLHGAFTLSASASVRVTLDRAGLSCRVSCEQPGYAFNTEVQGRDGTELALRTADAVVVGLGRRFALKSLFADTRVAFLSTIGVGRREIYAGNLLMLGVRQLTRLNCDNLGPRWSADGTRVAFVSHTRQLPDLYVVGYPAGQPRPLIAGMRGTLTGGATSPDGRRLVFCSSSLGRTLDLFVADSNGGNRRCLLRTDDRVESDASWSPDSQQIIFAAGAAGSPRLFVLPASGGTPTQLATGGGYASEPSWNRVERSRVAFTQAGEGTNSVAVLDISKGTVTVAAQGSASLAHSRATWCADGRHLVVQTQQRGTDRYWLSLVDAGTGKVSRLTGDQLRSCTQPDCWYPVR